MSTEALTTKELHKLLIQRIYHEDNLLQQRTYNYITANVFLGAGFVAAIAIDPASQAILFAYVLTLFGFLWALLQVAYGKRQVIATTLWRQQAWMAEKLLNTKFDITLFEFYDLGRTDTPFGTITTATPNKKPPNKIFPYNLAFYIGANVVFGVTVPQMMALFWFALTLIMLHNHRMAWWIIAIIVTIMIILYVLSVLSRPPSPGGLIDEHLLPGTWSR